MTGEIMEDTTENVLKCITHKDRNAVAKCGRCGEGLCNECEANAILRLDNNQAMCNSCGLNAVKEQDRYLKAFLNTKMISAIILAVAFVIGLGAFLIFRLVESKTITGVIVMMACWGLGGFITRFVSKDFAAATAQKPNDTLPAKIGAALAVALFCPFYIITFCIGILRVKKQIADNNAILSEFTAENTQ
jgi:hypothetical protein